MLFNDKTPIIAIATAPGRGGIGVIRLSFEADLADPILAALFPQRSIESRRVQLLPFLDENNALLDHTVVLYFSAPASYTGESVLEIQAHGGPVLLKLILRAALTKLAFCGLRIAEPGEFTKRAFLNGRMDLTQAEAVSGLIDAASEAAAHAAARSLSGDFSREVHAAGDLLDEARALSEASLDFPEEDLEDLKEKQIFTRAREAQIKLEGLLANARRGVVLADGITVALVGAPNVGKSSLLNALAGDEVAIVTEIAGTTRDRIEHWTAFDGIPLRIVDTAGMRETNDIVEQKGIERTLKAISEADIVLHLVDASGRIPDDEALLTRVREYARPGTPLLIVANKIDSISSERRNEYCDDASIVPISAKTHEGLEALKARVLEYVDMAGGTEGVFLARERHLECLRMASAHLSTALEMSTSPFCMMEIFAEELRLAGRALGELLGETDAEDLLGIIFSRFCIGK